MNTVTASFNTSVRQMTEMFQWPICLSKNYRNVSAKKHPAHNTHVTETLPIVAWNEIMSGMQKSQP